MEHNENLVKEHFQRMTPERRQKSKGHYEKLLLIESGNYTPGIYPIEHKLSGRQRPYPSTMPWMVTAWKNGLRLLNEVILNESTN